MAEGGALRASRADPAGTILAFDFGTRRIGVAVGDPATRIAHALETIDTRGPDRGFGRIGALIQEWHPARLLVGRPASDGEAHETDAKCRRFANQLRGRFGLPVDFSDERLSSWEAEAQLRDAGVSARRARPKLDAAAARVILQTYLDAAA